MPGFDSTPSITSIVIVILGAVLVISWIFFPWFCLSRLDKILHASRRQVDLLERINDKMPDNLAGGAQSLPRSDSDLLRDHFH